MKTKNIINTKETAGCLSAHADKEKNQAFLFEFLNFNNYYRLHILLHGLY